MSLLSGKNQNYVYILKCSDSSLYTGWTNDLVSRVNIHNTGKGAKYTRGRRPCELVYFESFDDKSPALKREHAIKRLSREEKLKLIDKFNIPKDIKKDLI